MKLPSFKKLNEQYKKLGYGLKEIIGQPGYSIYSLEDDRLVELVSDLRAAQLALFTYTEEFQDLRTYWDYNWGLTLRQGRVSGVFSLYNAHSHREFKTWDEVVRYYNTTIEIEAAERQAGWSTSQ